MKQFVIGLLYVSVGILSMKCGISVAVGDIALAFICGAVSLVVTVALSARDYAIEVELDGLPKWHRNVDWFALESKLETMDEITITDRIVR